MTRLMRGLAALAVVILLAGCFDGGMATVDPPDYTELVGKSWTYTYKDGRKAVEHWTEAGPEYSSYDKDGKELGHVAPDGTQTGGNAKQDFQTAEKQYRADLQRKAQPQQPGHEAGGGGD